MSTGIISGLVAITILVVGVFFTREMSRRAMIAFLSGLMVPYLMVMLVIGTPSPNWLVHSNHLHVLNYVLAENKAIYMWVLPEGSDIPVYIYRPWSTEEANQIIQQFNQSKVDGHEVWIQLGSGQGPHGDMAPWEMPVKPNPPKYTGD